MNNVINKKVLLIMMLLIPKLVSAFTLVSGQEYSVCTDMLIYFNDMENKGLLNKRPRFSSEGQVFKAPVWNPEKVSLGIKLSLQSYSYLYRSIDKWRKKLLKLEDIIGKGFEVYSTRLDINNDGKKERIVSYSRASKYGVYGWAYLSYVVDNDYNNIDIDFYDDSSPTAIRGELFLHKGRSFSLSYTHEFYVVHEFFERTLFGRSGVVVKRNVCEISK